MPGSAERHFELYVRQQVKRMEAQERILAITEETARYEIDIGRQRHKDSVDLAKFELKHSADEVRRGQWFAILAMALLTVGGFIMVHLGHSEVGIAAFAVEGIGAAKWFLHDTRGGRAQENKGAAQEATEPVSQP